MNLIYWLFVIGVVLMTFYVIFRSLSKKSYWIMIVIAILYTALLTISFLTQ
ncbi:hypothetical protein LCL89_13465 [Halobacillus yeomjeoni]|uniref:Uncharacterized protein n=1 Tax=Halobacillus yeomjeoni TaxID=311194 RepID=A0A931HY68_9BACI|nr:hypothetical protein [Halobacillus yeomjeoni]MBH0231633.1 hypothetical protein [Halobacillus yeomjeoni]MCA0985047.1 hypothetical protein [Halobacillus yeomjeoni]